MKQHKKTEVREKTLKLLYEKEFNDPQKKAKDPLDQQTQKLFEGVNLHQEKIDQHLKKTSQYWTQKRMSLIDLNIMRIAIYEMLYASPPIPFKVCINEALEMAKLYGTEDSYKFINGNLDSISKEIKTEA